MTKHMTAKTLLRSGSLMLLAVVLLGYSLSRASDLLFGIHLNVLGIRDGQSVTSPTLEVSGEAKHATGVTIDGHRVSVDTHGVWRDTVVLLPGYNAVTVTAADKFGRTVSNQFAIYYDAPVQALSAPTPTQPESPTAALARPVAITTSNL
jgi:hypothetical protein